ncbi:Fis family transcriptional regulator, partial [Alkalibaculum sp. M08DMB]
KNLDFDVEEEKILSTNSKEININLKEINKLVEDNIIKMLEASGMNKTEIAKSLGISRTALWKKNTN